MTTLDGLAAGLRLTEMTDTPERKGQPNGTFCPRCGDPRRMSIYTLFWKGESTWRSRAGERLTAEDDAPAAFLLECVQCHSNIVVAFYAGPSGAELVALPETYGGLSTPHTAASVAYYLDQAQRSQAVGALSAAVAMYRAALEHLLYEQGYTQRMLGPKIDALTNDSDPPAWVRDLDREFLDAIKDLGNHAIHPNDGDVERQGAIDAALLGAVRALFVELLDDVYEQPRRRAARLGVFNQARAAFRRDRPA